MHLATRRRPGARPTRAAVRALALALGAALLGLPAIASAQPVLGPGDDAFVLPFGNARFGVGGTFENWNQIYGPGGVLEPFGRRLAPDSLGARQIPDVGRAQRSLSTLVSQPSPAVSLGHLVVDASARRTTVPLIAEMGVLPRVMLSVTVPIVRTHTEVSRTLNPGGTDGNLGPNPVLAGSTSQAASRTANALLQSQLGAARTRLTQLLTSCPATGGPAECAPINADRAGATALSQRAEAFQTSSVTLYGNGSDTLSGLAYVPIVGTSVNEGVRAGVKGLADAFQRFGVTQLVATSVPAPSTVRLAEAGVGTIGTDVEAGFGLDSLQGATRVSIGDIEAMASVLLFDGFGSGAARFTGRGVRARVSAGAGLRLGTGEASYSQFDRSYMLPTGTGAGALLLRGAVDLAAGSRAWASVTARYAQPFEQTLPLRVPDQPGEVLLALYREQSVTRTLGRTLELEVTPRWALNSTLAIAGQYVYRNEAADEYRGTFAVPESEAGFDDVVLDASVLGQETAASVQRAGLGLSYSSVDAFRRGRTRVPVDVTFLHTWTIDADGGLTPRATTDELRVRVWMRLFGR